MLKSALVMIGVRVQTTVLILSWREFLCNLNYTDPKTKQQHNYSETSMTRTPMACLPWMVRTSFLSPYEILPIAQENKYIICIKGFFLLLFSHEIVCVYSLGSPHRSDSI